MTVSHVLSAAWDNGYAGALAWSLNGSDSASNFEGHADEFASWSRSHDPDVNLPWLCGAYLPVIASEYYAPPSPPLNISNTPGQSTGPAIAMDGQRTAHVVWAEGSTGSAQVTYAQKSPGQPWSSPVAISAAPGLFSPPVIAVDNASVVHVLWATYASPGLEFYYTRKAPGAGWSAPRVLIQDPSARSQGQLALAAACEGGVHLVWTNCCTSSPSGRWWLTHARIASGGTVPESPRTVGYSVATDPVYPAIAADAGCALHLVYNDWAGAGTKWDLFYRKRRSSGTWTSPQNIARLAEDAHAPAIAVGPGDSLHVVWDNLVYNGDWRQDIFYTGKAPGQGWATPENVTNSPPSYYWSAPVVAVDGSGTVHVVWDGLKYVYRPANRPSWIWESYGASGSDPAMTADAAGRIHMVWAGSDGDIYYATR